MTKTNRRDWLTTVGGAAGLMASGLRRHLNAQTPVAIQSDTPRFFPGFKSFRVKTTGAEIHGVIGGSGPPVLVLHGAPQAVVARGPKVDQAFKGAGAM